MSKRVIGATLFVVFFVLMLFSDYYKVMYDLFLLVGIYEAVSMYLNNKRGGLIKISGYAILYLCGLIAMSKMTNFSPGFMLYISCLIMFCDTFAYTFGRKFGKTKLSSISPNKTVEGALGGIIMGTIAANVLLLVLRFLNIGEILIFDFSSIKNYALDMSFLMIVLISIIVCILGIVGDLLESYIKRTYLVKDSGNFVYGHGGIMDRIDSWIVSTIVVYLVIGVL